MSALSIGNRSVSWPQHLPDQETQASKPSSFRTILPSTLRTKTGTGRYIRRSRFSGSRKVSRFCGVPLCRTVPCTLSSHHAYARRPLERATSDLVQHAGHSQAAAPFAPPLMVSLDTLSLPLDDRACQNLQIRKLFQIHHTIDLARIHKLLIPPSSDFLQWRPRRTRQLFEGNLQSSLTCLNGIASAYALHHAIPDHIEGRLPRTALMVQSQLMQQLRGMMDIYNPEQHAGSIISIMLTLVIFDVQIGRMHTLCAHRAGMRKVIDSCGGLHSMGTALPFAFSLDQLIALQLDQPPLYSNWDLLDMDCDRAPYYSFVYGTSLISTGYPSHVITNMDPQILTYCIETCRAIEILEGEGWHYSEPGFEYKTTEIFFMYYLRDRLIGKVAYLNARTAGAMSRERCVLLAAYIVNYSVLMDGLLQGLPIRFADTLRNILCSCDATTFWAGWMDVYLWILLVLVCAPSSWTKRAWAVRNCQQVLDQYFCVDWRTESHCKDEVFIIAQSFVWSNTRFNKKLDSYWAILTESVRTVNNPDLRDSYSSSDS